MSVDSKDAGTQQVLKGDFGVVAARSLTFHLTFIPEQLMVIWEVILQTAKYKFQATTQVDTRLDIKPLHG